MMHIDHRSNSTVAIPEVERSDVPNKFWGSALNRCPVPSIAKHLVVDISMLASVSFPVVKSEFLTSMLATISLKNCVGWLRLTAFLYLCLKNR